MALIRNPCRMAESSFDRHVLQRTSDLMYSNSWGLNDLQISVLLQLAVTNRIDDSVANYISIGSPNPNQQLLYYTGLAVTIWVYDGCWKDFQNRPDFIYCVMDWAQTHIDYTKSLLLWFVLCFKWANYSVLSWLTISVWWLSWWGNSIRISSLSKRWKGFLMRPLILVIRFRTHLI